MPIRYGKARTKRNKTVTRIRRRNESAPGFVGVVISLSLTDTNGKVVTLGPGAMFLSSLPPQPDPP